MAVTYERKQVTGTEANVKRYAGHLGQLAFAHDTKHLHVLSGTAGQTTELANKADIPAPVDISGKADKSYVDTELAKKATTDALTQGLAGKANLEHTHTVDNVTGLQTALNTIQDKIPKVGSRGNARGWNEASEGYSVQQDASDLQWANSANRNVTVPAGTAGTSWVKAVFIHRGTVTLRANWHWANGEAPELKYPCVLVCYWNNNKGIASVINGVA